MNARDDDFFESKEIVVSIRTRAKNRRIRARKLQSINHQTSSTTYHHHHHHQPTTPNYFMYMLSSSPARPPSPALGQQPTPLQHLPEQLDRDCQTQNRQPLAQHQHPRRRRI